MKKKEEKKKKHKSVQINNLKWHSEWHSASPFPVTVSCSQTGSLYISIHELVPGETLWSRWLFFFLTVWGEVRGVCILHRVTAGRGRGVVIGECRSWPPTYNDHPMDVQAWGQMSVRGEQGKLSGWMEGCYAWPGCLITVLWKLVTVLLFADMRIMKSFQELWMFSFELVHS